ncbi:MAG: AarF/ABC1/UbiB kinase family protein [Bacteroidetes bacterium]|nr:AarF/ABC1/UbiB kinase family protein [Bacteroidota bacterium]
MSQDRLPTGKIERAGRFLRTGAKIGGNYARFYGKKALLLNPDKEDLQAANAEDILDEFTQLRGTALKVAQMLSMDNINFSERFTGVLQQAQYSVPPMSAPMAVKAFTQSHGKSPEEVFARFNPEAVKAASMGQVHEAWLGDTRLAVKIQYPGVADAIRSDMRMVRRVAPTIVRASAAEMKPYMDEVESKLMEEADYLLELRNSLAFAEACGQLPGLCFPRYLPEYCSKRVITMEWLPGLHLRDFLQTNPTQETINLIGQRIWDFYEFQIHRLRLLNADPHPGNFLFLPDGRVGVLDFGCTKRVTEELYQDYFALAEEGLFEDPPRAQEVLRKIEILRPEDSPAKAETLTEQFGTLISLVTRPYHQGAFDFGDHSYFREINRVGTEISKTREVRGSREFLFVNRTYFGLFALLHQMGAQLHTQCQYRDVSRK